MLWIFIGILVVGAFTLVVWKVLSPSHPNVVLIIVDDLNTRLGSYGYPFMHTPNVDRLSKRGRQFNFAYCQFPLCTPSRTSLISGLRPEFTHVWHNPDKPLELMKKVPTIPKYFRQHGYITTWVGKLTNYYDPNEWDVVINQKIESEHEGKLRMGPINKKDEQTNDGRNVRAAINFIKQPHKRPFLIAVGIRTPHVPWFAPRKYFDLYSEAKIALPDVPAVDLEGVPNIERRSRTGNPENAKKAIRAYYACISHMDAEVGFLLNELEKAGLSKNTVVVFSSDHGYLLGEHHLWGKNKPFEETAHVPLIFAGPGIRQPGKPTASIAELIDIFPTLTDLCGLPRPAGLHGRSLVPILREPSASVKEAAYTMSIPNRNKSTLIAESVRTAGWRYTEWGQPKAVLFYDQKDPGEHQNVIDQPAYRRAAASMKLHLSQMFLAITEKR